MCGKTDKRKQSETSATCVASPTLNDLLPCPFCGAPAQYVEEDPVKLKWVRVECTGCHITTPLRVNHEKVKTRWNNRNPLAR